MLKKIKNLTRYNQDIYENVGKRLETPSKLSSSINLMLNLAYKVKQKLGKSRAKPEGGNEHQLLIKQVTHKNSVLFANQILIVAELSIPQCTKYRVTQKKAMLEYLGFGVQVTSWTDKDNVIKLMQYAGRVVFYRVPAVEVVINYFKLAKAFGVTTYFDVDDLVFDVEKLKENKALLHLKPEVIKEVYQGAELYLQALLLADYGIASTQELANHMSDHMKKPVYVLHNAVDKESLMVATSIHPRTNQVKIVYGSGTNTHNEDFLVVADALLMILKEFSHVNLVIYGFLDLDERFKEFDTQILRVPFVNAYDYYRALGGYDIAIAPLLNTVFNHCKSNIKFLESALYKVATVCSNVREFHSIVRNGETGFLASNPDEWYRALKSLIQNEDLRNKLAANAYQLVLEQYHWGKIANTQLARIMCGDGEFKPKAKVLLVNVLFKPVSFGGATIVMENIAQYIQSNKLAEVLVFNSSFDSNIQLNQLVRDEVDGVSILRTRTNYHLSREVEYNNPEISKVFEKIIKAYQPDLVHFHSIQFLGAGMAKICIQEKSPYIITAHDAWWFCERQFMIDQTNKYCGNENGLLTRCAACVPDSAFNHARRFYLFDVLNQASAVLCPSVYQEKLYQSVGFKTNILVNKNGVRQVGDLVKKTTPKSKIVFAFLGGRAVHKGYFELAKIFKAITGDFILKLVDLEHKLGASHNYLSDWTGVDKSKLSIVSSFEQEGLNEFYAGIDVLLFPSQCKESFGLTIREAMLRDVWVVATDCGGPIEDIQEGVNGNIVEFGNNEQFRQIVQNIINNPGFYKDYKNPLKDSVVTVEQQVVELWECYQSILKDNK